jgi:hypothetical protein
MRMSAQGMTFEKMNRTFRRGKVGGSRMIRHCARGARKDGKHFRLGPCRRRPEKFRDVVAFHTNREATTNSYRTSMG